MTVKALVFVFLFSFFTLFYGDSVLLKHDQLLSLNLKTYSISSTEGIALYGAMRKHFLTDQWYWGEFGYGAIAGIRSGYLEGGLVSGYLIPVSPKWELEAKLMVGAGGGGSAPQGGGLLVNPSLGLQYEVNKRWDFYTDLGYIRFLNGNIESLTFGCGVQYLFWKLEVQ